MVDDDRDGWISDGDDAFPTSVALYYVTFILRALDRARAKAMTT